MSKTIFSIATAVLVYGILKNMSIQADWAYWGMTSNIGPYVLAAAGYCAAMAYKLVWE